MLPVSTMYAHVSVEPVNEPRNQVWSTCLDQAVLLYMSQAVRTWKVDRNGKQRLHCPNPGGPGREQERFVVTGEGSTAQVAYANPYYLFSGVALMTSMGRSTGNFSFRRRRRKRRLRAYCGKAVEGCQFSAKKSNGCGSNAV